MVFNQALSDKYSLPIFQKYTLNENSRWHPFISICSTICYDTDQKKTPTVNIKVYKESIIYAIL